MRGEVVVDIGEGLVKIEKAGDESDKSRLSRGIMLIES